MDKICGPLKWISVLMLCAFCFSVHTTQLHAVSKKETFETIFTELLQNRYGIYRFKELTSTIKATRSYRRKLYRKLRSSGRHELVTTCKVIRTLGPIAKKTIPRLRRLLTHKDFSVSACVAKALGTMGKHGKVALRDLIKMLSDKNYFRRVAALDALAELGPHATRARPALFEIFTKSKKSSNTRLESLHALTCTQMPAKRLFPLIETMLKERGESCHVQRILLDGLSVYRKPKKRWIHRLTKDIPNKCKKNVKPALAFLKSVRPVPIELFMLKYSQDRNTSGFIDVALPGATTWWFTEKNKRLLKASGLQKRLAKIFHKQLLSTSLGEVFTALAGLGDLGRYARPSLKRIYSLYKTHRRLEGRITLTLWQLAPYTKPLVPLMERDMKRSMRKRGFVSPASMLLLFGLGGRGQSLRKYTIEMIKKGGKLAMFGWAGLAGIGAKVKDISRIRKGLKSRWFRKWVFLAACSLGPKAKPLIPQLTKIFLAQSKERSGMSFYIHAVSRLGRLAKPLLPTLLAYLRDDKSPYQSNALWAFGCMNRRMSRHASKVIRRIARSHASPSMRGAAKLVWKTRRGHKEKRASWIF